MKIELFRQHPNDFCTIGTMTVDGGNMEFITMELPVTFEGKANVPDKTCILAGSYTVKNLYSAKHWQMMPHVMSVPDRDWIEIHPASRPRDILGCIAIGNNLFNGHPQSADDVVINESDQAFSEFYHAFISALNQNEEVTLDITEEFQLSA